MSENRTTVPKMLIPKLIYKVRFLNFKAITFIIILGQQEGLKFNKVVYWDNVEMTTSQEI